MSLELLNTIREAESKAEAIKAEAQREAREIIKGVEAAVGEAQRQGALENRTLYQQIVEEKRRTVQSHIDSKQGQRDAQRLALSSAAQACMDQAVTMIVERVIGDGNR